MDRVTRRRFLRTSGAVAASLILPSRRVLGANGDIRMAVLGVGGRGGGGINSWHRLAGCRVVAIADADQSRIDGHAQRFAKDHPDEHLDTYLDYRRILDRDDVDAVYIASPNHWHSLMAIHACQAGKDVYVEKPVSHHVWEGRRLVEAAAKCGRMVQGGTQNRSDVGLLEAFPWLAAGNLGKPALFRGMCYRDRSGIGRRDTPLAPPESVDYNLWLGPAADLPIFRSRFHYDWHWVWNTGNGDIGNQAPHELDLICWALGDPPLPNHVTSFGGRFGWHDAGETANMQVALYDFNGFPAIFEVRDMWVDPEKKGMPNYRGAGVAVVLEYEGGSFVGGRGGGRVYDQDGKEIKQYKGGDSGHFANFLTAVRSRKESDLRAPIRFGHTSSALAHVANISYRLGATLSPDELRERMSADPQALDAIGRYSEQLANWKIDYAQEPWTLGATLTIDPAAERFAGNVLADEANALLRRKDREPFVVPENV